MKIYEFYTGAERDMLLHAYDFARDAHRNQKRASGEPYFIHPCAVAEILVDLGLDAETIAAALLHDVIEDTPVTEEDVRREFGEGVLTESRAQARIIRNAARFLTDEAREGAIMNNTTTQNRTYNQQSSVTLTGNTFTIRDEQDIYALANEIAALTRRQQRGKGLRMA